MTIHPREEDRWKPYRLGAKDDSFTIDLLGNCRMHHGMWHEGGQLVDFVMSQQVWIPDQGEWIDIVRIDTCHGEVHIHRFDADTEETRKVIREIMVVEDVAAGLVEAETIIYDGWAENLRRWEHGR